MVNSIVVSAYVALPIEAPPGLTITAQGDESYRRVSPVRPAGA